MTNKTKLIAIVATLWVAAVVVISVAFYANRTDDQTYLGPPPTNHTCDIDGHTIYRSADAAAFEACVKATSGWRYFRTFEWGGWLAWTGSVTLAAAVVVAITLIALSGKGYGSQRARQEALS